MKKCSRTSKPSFFKPNPNESIGFFLVFHHPSDRSPRAPDCPATSAAAASAAARAGARAPAAWPARGRRLRSCAWAQGESKPKGPGELVHLDLEERF